MIVKDSSTKESPLSRKKLREEEASGVEEVEEARALKSVACPRCGKEGVLKASHSSISSLVYVEHREEVSGKVVRARCYLGLFRK
jgi:hypothetical protein